jgi:hypothetical protein
MLKIFCMWKIEFRCWKCFAYGRLDLDAGSVLHMEDWT